MHQTRTSADGERPDDDPYAPPRAETRPGVDEKETDQVGRQRREHIRRESCIRLTGLLSLSLAVIVILSFGLGTLSELRRQDSSIEDIEPWTHQRWIVRMTSVISLAIIAAGTSWGLFRLQNWGRWALTIVTTLPLPDLVCVWLLLSRTANPELQESLDPAGLTIMSVISALPYTLLLFLMWSPKGSMVFSPEYRETVRRTPHLRSGCSGIFPALFSVPAGLVSYFVLLMSVLSILLRLGVIRSL